MEILERIEITQREVDELRALIIANPLAFYEVTGAEYIMAMKELHVVGAAILRSAKVQADVMAILKKIPIEA